MKLRIIIYFILSLGVTFFMNNYQKIYLIIFGFLLSIIFLFNIIFDEFDWDVFDFIVLIIMMIFTAALFEIVTRIIKTKKNQKILFIFIVIIFLLIWAELGVGIFNSPFAGD
tara:strand:- start:3 stop:338 length:336 start_codon:yes stop_codon:yes gene_type:complete